LIILDTNVVSEPMRPRPNPAVIAWLDRQAIDTFYLTATSVAELLLGLALLPAGRRQNLLEAKISEAVDLFDRSHILPFDHTAAKFFAAIVNKARSAGNAISVADGQIAAIAASHGFLVATRDTAPFAAAGVGVINPWSD
jgi:predicted nucleic acid-binding protein